MRGLRLHFSKFLDSFRHTKFLDDQGAIFSLVAAGHERAEQFMLCLLQNSKSTAASLLPLLRSLAERSQELYPNAVLCHTVIKQLLSVVTADVANEIEVSALPWRNIPLVPHVQEIFGETILRAVEDLNHVRVRGAYPCPDEYLDTYYRLLRFDCFSEFNAGIRAYLQGSMPANSNLLTYSRIVLEGVQLLDNGGGLGLVVRFRPDQPPKNWKSSPHLRFGNLVCLSPAGDFREPLWAVVAERDPERLAKEQTASLELCGLEHGSEKEAEAISLLLSSKQTVMVESPTYYKAYEPVMKTLQGILAEEVPFADMLVSCRFGQNRSIDGSDFLGPQTLVDSSLIFKAESLSVHPCFSQLSKAQSAEHVPNLPSSSSGRNLFNSLLQRLYPDHGLEAEWNPQTPRTDLGDGVVMYSIVGDPGSIDTKEMREYNQAYAQFVRLVTDRRPRIKQIDVYENKRLEENFHAESCRMSSRGIKTVETWVFHGTGSSDNVSSIMKEGFKVGGKDGIPVVNGAAFGNGVYSATTPNTPMQYGRGTQQVILAKALQGKQEQDSWQPQSDWIVFRTGRQLLPRFVIHYEECQIPLRFISVGEWADGKSVRLSKVMSWIGNAQHYQGPDLGELTELDHGQLKAVQVALENRVSLIQGPPGTGKTFIGVKILQLFLSANTFPRNRPILVLTYKNHALDEFLEDCIKKIGDSGVVRVGGRSDSKILQARNLNVVKREHKQPQAMFEACKLATQEIDESKTEVREALSSFRRSMEEFSVWDFLEVAYEPQIEHIIQSCDWKREILEVGDSKIKSGEVISWLKSVPSDTSLQRFLKEELGDAKLLEVRTKLLDALERALALWQPGPQAFEAFRRIHVSLPPLSFESLDPDLAVEVSKEVREVDAEEEEPERRAADPSQKWRSEDFVALDSGTKHESMDMDISSVCTEAVASSLRQYSQLWDLDSRQRACLVCMWMQANRDGRQTRLSKALARYSTARKSMRELHDNNEADVLQNAKVIGMTITGAAMRSRVLALVKPAVVIVEEAGEVLESHMLACIGPWVQRLVMIGDHKQLRPQVNCYELVRNHSFDVSMFERLINNGIQHGILNTQNRMRPEFVSMLKEIYPTLCSNHARVDRNVAPRCVSKSMWFWTHSDRESTAQSISNQGECERVVALALFFVQQGYHPSKVTVLAAYKEQMRMVRDQLQKKLPSVWQMTLPVRKGRRIATLSGAEVKEEDVLLLTKQQLKELLRSNDISSQGEISKEEMIDLIFKKEMDHREEIAVHTIDQYQGDENDIVIVSLVRSNKDGDIGFLKTQNRYCVAVSRARCGVYFVGNIDTLSRKSNHWNYLRGLMGPDGCALAGMGPTIPLQCCRHPTCRLDAERGADIDLSRGICRMRCGAPMPCGVHKCDLLCHWDDERHRQCKYRVQFRSSCGHMNTRLCCEDENDVVCASPCALQLPCGHPCPHTCRQPCAQECEICMQEALDARLQQGEAVTAALAALLTGKKRTLFTLFPKYWNQHPESLVETYRLVDESQDFIKHVQEFINSSCDSALLGAGKDQVTPGRYSGLQVVRVQRVENPAVWLQYRLRYSELLRDRMRLPVGKPPDSNLNRVRTSKTLLELGGLDQDVGENYLFHGTRPEIVKRIVSGGFEERLANLGGMYGAGTYFADRSSKSDQYTTPDSDADRTHYLFIARVLLGAHIFVSSKALRDLRILPEILAPPSSVPLTVPTSATSAAASTAPSAEAGSGGVRYSSLLGLAGAHREYVVYDGRQAYPEYLVHYRRCSRHTVTG